jgi:hypothetical protein
MSFDGTFCSKESRRIEEIKDVHEETLKRYADCFKHNSGKYEKRPDTGNLHMNHIEPILG